MILELNKNHKSILHISSVDSRLGHLISEIGDYSLQLNRDYFEKLVSSIVGQQLSIKAKQTIWSRIVTLCKDISPENILSISDQSLREAGLSFAKISYIKGLANASITGSIDLKKLDNLSNDEVIEALSSIKGIGKWTAEMFLIFSLGRLDVFSTDDAGLKRAIKWLYGYTDSPTVAELNKISLSWKPYRTVASLYLWEAVNTDLVNKDLSSVIGNNNFKH